MTTTWNPADKSAHITLSNGDHTASSGGGAGNEGVRATSSHSSGKWYIEFSNIVAGGGGFGLGFGSGVEIFDNNVPQFRIHTGGYVYTPGGGTFGTFSDPSGHVIQFAIDIDALKAYIRYDSGGWGGPAGVGTADPAAGTGGFDISGLTLPSFPKLWLQSDGRSCDINAGDLAFSYSAPSGFTPWDGVAPFTQTKFNLIC